jgi:hypothetical protein
LSIVNPLNQLTDNSDLLVPPWPDLVITCGRRSAPLGVAIKKQSNGQTFCVHIQNPQMYKDDIDLIVAPSHDHFTGPNVVTNKGALHKVTQEKIQAGIREHGDLFKNLKHPLNFVLLGGNTHRYTMPQDGIEEIIRQIFQIREVSQGSVLVSPSFRTPYRDVLRAVLKGQENIYLAEIEELNPYFAMLGLADTIFVTDDSVNMVSEACYTGKPVYILPMKGHKGSKPQQFVHGLIDEKFVRPFEGRIEKWTYTPFNDTERIAKIVREKMNL